MKITQRKVSDKATLKKYNFESCKSKKRIKVKLLTTNVKRQKEKKYRYPRCPSCNLIGTKGLHRTNLGNVSKGVERGSCVRCKSCNALFEVKINPMGIPTIVRKL